MAQEEPENTIFVGIGTFDATSDIVTVAEWMDKDCHRTWQRRLREAA